MNYKLWFWIVNIISTALRLLIISKIGLTIDEAHYWDYTKFSGLSYFAHSPFITYLIKASTLIFGNNKFAVRFPTVVIFFLTSWIFFICAKKLYNERTAFTGILLLNVLLVFSFLGSVITVLNSPPALFWLLSLLVFIVLIETNNKNYWYLLGIITGFAMLSRYNAILIPFSIFLFLFLSPKHRFWFARKEPYLALIISVITFSLVIMWNIENNWASFGFQLKYGLCSAIPKFSFMLFGRSIGAQAEYVSPLVFLIFIVAAALCIKEAYQKKNRQALIIACFSLPVLVFFNGIATFNEILPHWSAMGYLVLSIYVAHLTLKFWHIKWFRIYSYATWGLAVFMITATSMHALYRIIPSEKFLPQSQIEKVEHGIAKPERIDVANEVYGWKEVGNEIRKIINAYPSKEKPFVFTYKSYLASELATSVPELRGFCISGTIDAYDLWQRNLDTLRNKDGLFICNDFFFSNPKERYGEKIFTSYTEVEIFPVYRDGKKIKNFFFTVCKFFNPVNLPYEYTADALGQKKELTQELIKFDHIIFRFINSDLKCKFLDFFATPISYCDSKYINISFFAILIISIAILWENKKDRFWMNLALLASVTVVSNIATFYLKYCFDRPRPLTVFGDENVNTLFEKLYKNSFPSGHTSMAVALCAFMFMTVKKYRYWQIFFAFASGLYRIYVGSHFPYDVLAGAALGIISTYVTVAFFRKYFKF